MRSSIFDFLKIGKEACRLLGCVANILFTAKISSSNGNCTTALDCVRVHVKMCSKDPSPAVRGEAMVQLTNLVQNISTFKNVNKNENMNKDTMEVDDDENNENDEKDENDENDENVREERREKVTFTIGEKRLMRAWSQGVLPLVGDPEATVQTKCMR